MVHYLKLLLRCGIEVTLSDYDRRTALHLAASEGMTEAIELLVELGAPINATDRWKHTPLDDAIREKQTEAIRLLKAFGAKIASDLTKDELDASNLFSYDSLNNFVPQLDQMFAEPDMTSPPATAPQIVPVVNDNGVQSFLTNDVRRTRSMDRPFQG